MGLRHCRRFINAAIRAVAAQSGHTLAAGQLVPAEAAEDVSKRARAAEAVSIKWQKQLEEADKDDAYDWASLGH